MDKRVLTAGVVLVGPQLVQPKKILRVITRLNIGGPSRQALTLTKALRPDYETILVAGRSAPYEGEMTEEGVDVVHVSLVRPISPRLDAQALMQLKRIVRRWQPDVIHTHQAKAGAIARLASSPRSKTVHTFHGHVLEEYFGGLARAAFLSAERLLARRTDVLVAVSQEIQDALLDLGIGNRNQWRVIPLGFDLEPFLRIEGTDQSLRRRLGVTPEAPLVGVVGRLSPIKDHATLLQAMTRLEGVHLAVFGDGELHGELRREVAGLGLMDRVHFMGWWTDVASAMAGLDVVVLTSRNEGTPVSLIEALASGRPVVATDVGGVRSVVVDGVSGYVVPSRSPTAVADALRGLLSDPQKRSAMGAAGRAFVAKRFIQDRLVADTRALYSSLIDAA